MRTVDVSRDVLEAIVLAIRTTSIKVPAMSTPDADAGYQNVIVWPNPEEGFWDDGIILRVTE